MRWFTHPLRCADDRERRGYRRSGSGWSDRFEEGLHPSIERFNASIGFDITLLQQDLDGSVAHARMLGRCDLISAQESEQLIEGLETIRQAAAGDFPRPGSRGRSFRR